MDKINTTSKRHPREVELANRIENCELMIKAGYSADITNGVVYGIRNKERIISYPIKSGYIQISAQVGDKVIRIYAHHFIYYYANGDMVNEIDHIDNNKANNKISNLRNCTHRENMRNRPCVPNKRGKYIALLFIGGKNHYIGSFDTAFEKQRAITVALLEYKQTGKIINSLVRKNKK
jgi:hypothetical protein